ncbi:MAG TPA: helix-turn-helix transcriptional regulator [Mycobacteriales bacterium]|nr:helix-turn-helix transcriptional regulator [Mycobacteriales bacterium]
MGDGSQHAGDQAFRRTVGLRIRVWRVMHDRSQDDLARSAGVTRNFVSAIERGAQGLDAVRLRRLAVAMGVELAELLAEPDPVPDPVPDPDRVPEPA